MKEYTDFVKSTAKDYDMDCYDVERIQKNYPNRLYEELEAFIAIRKNT